VVQRGQVFLVELIRRFQVKGRVRSMWMITAPIACQSLLGSADRIVRLQADRFVFDALPEAFHKDGIPAVACVLEMVSDEIIARTELPAVASVGENHHSERLRRKAEDFFKGEAPRVSLAGRPV